MYDAILGDMIGAPYEFCYPPMKSKRFPLFAERSPGEGAYWFTDDTLGCITGAVAEAYYGEPEELIFACRSRLPADLLEVVDFFYARVN